jgi:hypothetical protein
MKRLHNSLVSRALLTAAAMLVVLGVACASEASEPELQARFCNDLSELSDDVGTLVSSVATVDRSATEEAVDGVEESLNEVRESAREISSSNVEQIEAAYNDLQDAIGELDREGGGGGSFSPVSTALTAFLDSVREAVSQYDCRQDETAAP